MNINLHIERLVLDGLPIRDTERPALQRAVEAELTRLLTEGGLSSALLAREAVPRMSAGHLQLEKKSDPGRVGQQVARAVYGEIGP